MPQRTAANDYGRVVLVWYYQEKYNDFKAK